MSVPAEPAMFKEAMIVLGAAGLVVPLVHQLRLSPVLGFMAVGLLVGPFGLGALAPALPWLEWVSIRRPETIAVVAELGVVLLMFMIGLEMAFERLRLMARLVFGLGPLQIGLSMLAIGLVLLPAGWGREEALVVGVALAMSSTAVVVQVLSDARRLTAPLGRLSFAVLLMQDLAVVPVLFVLASLGGRQAGWLGLAWTMAQSLLAIAAIVGIGRLVLRPLFRAVARTASAESFIAACLLVILATALLAEAAGMSMAIGALLAGLLLAETEFRRQVEVTIAPFKGLLLGVFLLSVGMSLDLAAVAARPFAVLAGALGLIVLKSLIVALLARGFGHSWRHGIQAGLLLGPGGEFGFVILALAREQRLVDPALMDLALVTVALTMTAIPLLYRLTQRIEPPTPVDPALQPPLRAEGPQAVLIAGFGRVGQTVAAMLKRHGIPYLALDLDPDRVGRMRAAGHDVYYGDMTRPEMLQRLDLPRARALVVTLDDRRAADALVRAARAMHPGLRIIARARDAAHAAALYATGATDAVPETIEASLQLCEAVLVDLGVPMGRVIVSIHEQRAEFQDEIRARAPEARIRPLGQHRIGQTPPGAGGRAAH
jgi:CPA2 family monovalent cation:H+ antiporter-2